MTGSKGLMKLNLLRAHHIYRNAAGKVVPGVSSIKEVIANPALMHWAWTVGVEGQDYRKVRDRAADLGTITHARIEARLRGYDDLDPTGLDPNQFAQSTFGFERFQQDWDGRGYQVVEAELRVVSEELQVGGTLDILALDPKRDELHLWDIKTSRRGKSGTGIYSSMKYQVAGGYAQIYRHATQRTIDHVWICRVGKERDDVLEVKKIESGERAACEAIFRHARAIYEQQRKVA